MAPAEDFEADDEASMTTPDFMRTAWTAEDCWALLLLMEAVDTRCCCCCCDVDDICCCDADSCCCDDDISCCDDDDDICCCDVDEDICCCDVDDICCKVDSDVLTSLPSVRQTWTAGAVLGRCLHLWRLKKFYFVI
jgi:hypothetical protein